jgi:hypothetical protein
MADEFVPKADSSDPEFDRYEHYLKSVGKLRRDGSILMGSVLEADVRRFYDAGLSVRDTADEIQMIEEKYMNEPRDVVIINRHGVRNVMKF